MTFIDSLEPRRLMSLVLDLRLPGGGKQVLADTAGQVINLELWARVTGANGTTADDGLLSLSGTMRSSAGGSVLGDLAATPAAPFNGGASQAPLPVDADGDGDLDAGADDFGRFFAHSGNRTFGGTPGAGGAAEFKVADVTFTVTHLLGGVTTELNFMPRQSSSITAVWFEDGLAKSNTNSTLAGGEPVVVRSIGGPLLGAINGSVYEDFDADGVRDPASYGLSAEPPLKNWGVYLDANRNALRDSGEVMFMTDAKGKFVFPLLPAGTYRVRELLSPGYRCVTPSAGYYDVTLGPSGFKGGLVFGNTDLAFVSGSVFNDTNRNGKRNPHDAGIAGRIVFNDWNQNGQLDEWEPSTTTDANGNYLLNTWPGDVYIRVLPQPGWRDTTPPVLKLFLAGGGGVSDQLFGQKPI
jgi:hypothetical protein